MKYIHPISEEYQEYLKDESRTTGNANTISFPTSEKEVVEIVKHLYQNQETITIQGARTGVAAGAVPKTGHAMNFSKMNGITGCTVENGRFLFGVEAGHSLIALNQKIGTKKMDTTGWSQESIAAFHEFLDAPMQFYPPDPTETTCSIGGMVSCNASGARSFSYGSVRNHIDGLRVVLADGELLHLKRGQNFAKDRVLELVTESGKQIKLDLPKYKMPTTKNASGYFVEDNMDAVDLFIGADGTLGIVTHITIVTSPLPQEIWGVSCFFASEKLALDFVIAVRKEKENIAALEYFDPNALEILRIQKKSGTAFKQLPEIPEAYVACVYCEIHTDTKELAQETMFRIGAKMKATGNNPEHTWVARNDGDLKTLQFFRHAVPECSNMIIDARKKVEPIITKLGSDMSVPNDSLQAVVDLYQTTLEAENLEYAIWGHIGDNHLHVNVLPKNAEDFYKGKELFKHWAKETSAMGGAVSAEHGVGKIKANFLEIMYGKEGIEEMRALKQSLDPSGLLNIGNLFDVEEVAK
ncbi:FAD-binding oxidoreductase [Chakrabartyella piscis]|uniref:FAD-binding oxidoreductase n=1 Tax=Chakrabartyella piscis TaxID=2918914 RepID=UPI00295872DB|nr:FAD-binding oxidoreductase [Chakrabartyella piscis]